MAEPTRRKGRPKGFYSKPETQTIQALDRALDVLDLLAAHNGLTLTETAGRLGQSPATISRVLTTLELRGVVEADLTDQSWHIGPTAYQTGSAFLRRGGMVERARPAMRALTDATGETSNLGIERAGQVMFVSQVETSHTIRAFFPPGTLSPMHASGIGKALLSCYAPDRLARYLEATRREAFTPKTVVEAEALTRDLAEARTRGWALDDEEKNDGMRCVAAPILDAVGEAVAGISVSGPTLRMSRDRIEEIGRLVRDAARDVSRGLGAAG